jgi:hypothetical protein
MASVWPVQVPRLRTLRGVTHREHGCRAATGLDRRASPTMNGLRRSRQLAPLPLARKLPVVSVERRGQGVQRERNQIPDERMPRDESESQAASIRPHDSSRPRRDGPGPGQTRPRTQATGRCGRPRTRNCRPADTDPGTACLRRSQRPGRPARPSSHGRSELRELVHRRRVHPESRAARPDPCPACPDGAGDDNFEQALRLHAASGRPFDRARTELSPRTIHAHLRSIYAKLGISSRSELQAADLDHLGPIPSHEDDLGRANAQTWMFCVKCAGHSVR